MEVGGKRGTSVSSSREGLPEEVTLEQRPAGREGWKQPGAEHFRQAQEHSSKVGIRWRRTKRWVWLEYWIKGKSGRRGQGDGEGLALEGSSKRNLDFIQSVKRGHLRVGSHG